MDAFEWIVAQPTAPASKDVLSALNIAPTTCYRILQVFQQRGWLRVTAGGRFAPGWKLLPICQRLTAHPLLGATAGELLFALAQDVGHTVKISLRDGVESVTLRREEATVGYGLSVQPGTRFPLTVGASGAMLLAQCPADVIAQAIASAPPEVWLHQTRSDLAQRIERARQAGWCVDNGSYRSDIFGLSVPLAAPGLGAEAALTVTGLAHGLPAGAVEGWIEPLRRAAAALEGLTR